MPKGKKHSKSKAPVEEHAKKTLPEPFEPLPFYWYKAQGSAQPSTQKEEERPKEVEVVKEGDLIKLSPQSKTPYEYHIVLKSDSFTYTSSKTSKTIILGADTTVEDAEPITISVVVPKEKKSKRRNDDNDDDDDDDDTSTDSDDDENDDDDDSEESDEESEEEVDMQFYGFTIFEKEKAKATFYINEEKETRKWIHKIEKCINKLSSPSKPESETEKTELDMQKDEGYDTVSIKDIADYKETNNLKEIQTYIVSALPDDEIKVSWRVFDLNGIPCRAVITKFRFIVASDDSPVTVHFNQHLLSLSYVKLSANELILEKRKHRSSSSASTPPLSTTPPLGGNTEGFTIRTNSSVKIGYQMYKTLKTISLKKYWPRLFIIHKGKEERLSWDDILQVDSKSSNEADLKKKLVNLYLSRCCLVGKAPNRAITDYLDYTVKTSNIELDFTQCAFGATGYEDAAVALDALRSLGCFKGVVVVGPGHTAKGTSTVVTRSLIDFVESNISALTRVVARSIEMDERMAASFGDSLKKMPKEHELCDVSFADNPLRDNGLNSIISGLLANSVSLRCINFSGCGITPKGFKSFFAALKRDKDKSIFVRELYLSDNKLEDTGSAALNEWITEFPEGTLSLRKLAIANTKANFELLTGLKAVSLELLDISWNTISSKACAVLGNAAVNTSRFVANGCTIQGKSLEETLKKFFSRSDKPKLLECSGTNSPFLPAVSSVLAKVSKSSITRLSLTGTTFSRDGFLSLASAIIMCESLYELDLSSPVFDLPSTIRGNESSWAQSLAAIIIECGALTTVDLSHGYGPLVISKFLETISKDRKYALRLLDISANEIGDRGASAIAGLLKSGSPLMGLVYGNNNITANGFLTIAAEIALNKSIIMLDSGTRRGLTCGIGRGFTNGSALSGTNSSNSSGIPINVVANGDDTGNIDDDVHGFQGFGMKNILRAERVIENVVLRNLKRLKDDYSKVPQQLADLLALGEDQYNPWTSSLSEDYEPYLVNPPLKTSPKVHK